MTRSKVTPFMLRGLYDSDGDGVVDAADQADYAAGLGSVLIDETDIANGKVPTYNSTSGNLEYETPAAGGGGTASDICLGQPTDLGSTHTYQYVSLTDAYQDTSALKSTRITVDVANLEAVFGAGSWELFVVATVTMNSTGSVICEVYNETDGASMGEVTVTPATNGIANPHPTAFGPFATSLPSAGVKMFKVHWRKATGDAATGVYFFGAYALYARAA